MTDVQIHVLSHAGASSGSYLDSCEADHRIQNQKHKAPILDMQKVE